MTFGVWFYGTSGTDMQTIHVIETLVVFVCADLKVSKAFTRVRFMSLTENCVMPQYVLNYTFVVHIINVYDCNEFVSAQLFARVSHADLRVRVNRTHLHLITVTRLLIYRESIYSL